ncbi:MAG: S41 family peptidase [Trueperaceae bacterium]
MKRKWLLGALGVIALSAALVYGQLSRDFTDEFLASPAGQAFMQAYGSVKSGYLNEEVEDEKIIQGAINGMLTALEDPFTRYEDPVSTKQSREHMSGSFEGIGATLEAINRETGEGVRVVNVYRDGPAAKAGVKAGDVFQEVDGTDVSTFTTSEVVSLVRGPKGTTVSIKMLRSSGETQEAVDFSIVRDTIVILDVESAMLPNNVGYLHLVSFANEKLYDQLLAEIEELKAQGATSLVLDMRDNGGGLLQQGVLVADTFLDQGDIVFTRARGVTQRIASADPEVVDLPMVVLVNHNSASASEIVAGALQENGRAKVVGEKTYGKGVAQNVIPLSDGGQLLLVAFEWLTPKRNSIQEEGITPDVYAEDTATPKVVSGEGFGVAQGKEVEIVIDGQVVAKGTANEDGEFTFSGAIPRRERSDIQGDALVNLENDNALKIAYDTLQQQIASSN